ncbi:long-chain acyl-CoA synthetase [Kibdelosporangium banguiense]|uniref:Acyl-CoA synthetase n=1 Tax=Kibdelosporangium banguiense TaxID=1365924 RepID=A0ABS4TG80_9PSEU|nr:AMP-dependent synthetase/ligase [Kibdelosporangium banguiense]MBP2322974.1 long-chain acyl-CoA synthetase [Kibdelosporangium banguiense]
MGSVEEARQAIDGQTVASFLRRNAKEFADLPAISSSWGPDATTLAWGEFREHIAALAHGLSELGLSTGDRMLIMSARRPEHWVSDLGALHLGAISCTTYDTLSPEQITFVARHSATPVVVLEGAEQISRWRPALDELPGLRKVVVINEDDVPAGDDRFVSYREVYEKGAAKHAADVEAIERLADTINPEQPACMIYTSGTTGDPKGVVLSHYNLLFEAASVDTAHPLPMHGKSVSYLPLAHIAERMLGIYLVIYKAGHTTTVADHTQLIPALHGVRPFGLFGVPRVWEKMAAALQGGLAAMPEEQRAGVQMARDAAAEVWKLGSEGKPVPEELAARLKVLDEKALLPIRTMLGLEQMTRGGNSGAAPIPVSVLDFLASIGIPVLEVWGLSETTGAVTQNVPDSYRVGSVGQALPGCEIKLGEDDELLVRGPTVFLGYLQADGTIKPDVDADGWYATGDVGKIDEDGFVFITDRKKELIITAGGKNIAPAKVEGLLRAHPLVSQAVAIGDTRPYMTALIVLDDEAAPIWAHAKGIPADNLAAHPVVLEELENLVQQANAVLSSPEQIKKYRVLSETWTAESGELTPTLKLKRRVITDRYSEAIASLYE